MERRLSRRLSVACNAAVYYDGRRIGPYRLRDISTGGACLVPGPIMFRPGCEVEVELPLAEHRDDEALAPRLAGTVVHTSEHGIGISFQDAGQAAASVVRTLQASGTDGG